MDDQDAHSAWLQRNLRPETAAERLQRTTRDYETAKRLSETHGGEWLVNGQRAESRAKNLSETLLGFDLGF